VFKKYLKNDFLTYFFNIFFFINFFLCFQIKLGLGSTLHFALVVEHVKSLRRNKLTLLDPKETLCKIASRPGAHNLRCLFRVTFVPVDSYDLLRKGNKFTF
jgi:hypothetical protein